MNMQMQKVAKAKGPKIFQFKISSNDTFQLKFVNVAQEMPLDCISFMNSYDVTNVMKGLRQLTKDF